MTDEQPTMAPEEAAQLPKANPNDLRDQHPRSTIPRKWVPFPELGKQLCIWGVSYADRLLIIQISQEAQGGRADKDEVWFSAYVSMAVRESDEDDAQQVWQADVDASQRSKVIGMGWKIIDRIVAESQALDNRTTLGVDEEAQQVVDFIAKAQDQMSSCLARLCSASNAWDGCPLKSSGTCILEESLSKESESTASST